MPKINPFEYTRPRKQKKSKTLSTEDGDEDEDEDDFDEEDEEEEEEETQITPELQQELAAMDASQLQHLKLKSKTTPEKLSPWLQAEQGEEELEPLKIRPIKGVTRDEWEAVEPSGPIKRMNLPLVGVIMSYTGSRPCTTQEECKRQLRKLQRRDMAKGFPDIRYSFVIGGDGYIYEGRGWDQYPEKNKMYKKLYGASIEIGMISRRGKYTSREDEEKEAKMHILERKEVRAERLRNNKPTPDMFHTAFDLINFAFRNRYLEFENIIVNSQ